jgi:hypothetical protein
MLSKLTSRDERANRTTSSRWTAKCSPIAGMASYLEAESYKIKSLFSGTDMEVTK